MKRAIGNGQHEWPKGPSIWQEGRTLFISIPFTWNLPDVRAQLEQRSFEYDLARVGGPAVDLMPNFFNSLDHVTAGGSLAGVLQRINSQATRTTLGCTRTCGYCAIGTGRVEGGGLIELDDWPDQPINCDNNILAASTEHFDKVIDRLIPHGWADFNQGLDARLLTEYHAQRIAEIGKPIVRLALDHQGMMEEWRDAWLLLREAGIPKKSFRTYALIGFNSGPEEAWERCRWIECYGGYVLPMWYHRLDALEHNIVTAEQQKLGWDDEKRKDLMMYFYQHIVRANRYERKVHPDQMRMAI